MTSIARLAGVSPDAADPRELAQFYRTLLDLETLYETEDFIELQGAAVFLTAMRVENHVAPDWPAGSVPKQAHLELAVDDLDAAESAALSLGATLPAQQPAPDRWRVLLDPAGHPFCLTTLIPEA